MANLPEHLSFATMAETAALEKAVLALEEMPLDEIAELLNAIYTPVLQEGETMPDWYFEMQLDRRLIAYLASGAVDGDQLRRSCVKKRQEGLFKQSRGAVTLRQDLWQLALKIESHYGTRVKKIIGLAGSRPTTPKVILDLAVLVRNNLRSDWFEFPEATLDERPPLDRFELADEIDKSITLMTAKVERSSKHVENAVTALAVKHDGQDQATLGRRTLVGRLRLLLLLANRPALAERLLLSPPRTQAEAAAQDPPDNPPPDNPPPDNPPPDDPPPDDPPPDDPPPDDPPPDDPPLGDPPV